MAFIQCDFFSETLGMCSSVNVLLPQSTRRQIGMDGTEVTGKVPVLWLLHGLSDDQTIWMRRTALERHVAGYPLAVVMPNVHRSYYTDQVDGYRYFTYVAEELPEIMRGFFHFSSKREDNFVAGLSMGGYGAMKIGLTHPNRYAAAASLSGVVDIAEVVSARAGSDQEREREFVRTFGDPDKIAGSKHDPVQLIRDLKAAGKQIPELYACCGTEDFLYHCNVTFRAALKEIGVPLTYEEGPGNHNWQYWDTMIQKVLAWLPLKKD